MSAQPDGPAAGRLLVGNSDPDLQAVLNDGLVGWSLLFLVLMCGVLGQPAHRGILVTSFTFQEPHFYEVVSYVETGRVEGLPVAGAADVQLRKWLQP